MTALKVQRTLSKIERNMSELAPYRKPDLFNKFLVEGYTAVTLSSVPPERFSDLLRAKLCLGTLITLYDDLADRPTECNPQLLDNLYKLRFGELKFKIVSSPRTFRVLEYARSLFEEIERILEQLPNYHALQGILNFDLSQFYSANHFSSLLTTRPYIRNTLENRLYAHHNMGMVMVAMIDLMAIRNLKFSEFGQMREVFLMGQRTGRIFNVLTTHKREVIEGDITGELAPCLQEEDLAQAKQKLKQEVLKLYQKIRNLNSQITNFSVKAYLTGLKTVGQLHAQMEGTI